MEKKNIRVLRNLDVKSITAGVPGKSHRHLRTAIETEDEIIVLQEATVAAIVRAYVTLKTHPQKRNYRLEGGFPDELKAGYAKWQLIETEEEPEKVDLILESLCNGRFS